MLFKNQNETAYVGGKKHFTDVIKNSGPASVLIWRQPEEDFNTNSTLIVMPGEQAIFIKDGVVEQVFENGKYKLSTENYPFISRLRNMFSGGVSSFNCVVYFVRTTHSMELTWGTSSPMQVRDKLLGISTKVGARGAYKIQITNPSKFLTKLVGNGYKFVGQQELINNYFANEFQGKIRSKITKYMNDTPHELLGIEAELDEISEKISPSIEEVFNEYGLKLIKFSIASMTILDDSIRRKYDEIKIQNIGKIETAHTDAAVFGILGDNWGRQQQTEILHNISSNKGAGGAMAGAGVGMGMGMGIGQSFNNLAQPTAQTQNQPSTEDPYVALEKLKKMLDKGLITQELYNSKMNEIVGRM